MKKYLPYVFPAIAVLIVIGLAFRWYSLRNVTDDGEVSDFGQSISIEQQTDEEAQDALSRVEDLESTQLEPQQEDFPGMAEVRYEVVDGSVPFTVFGNLPDTEGTYQVWIGETEGEGIEKALELEPGKAGYTASATVTAEQLPFDIVISEEMNPADTTPENIVLRGTIEEPTE
jgi:hypothetical protein